MKLRMFHVIVLVYVMHTYGQNYEVPPPLPKPNVEMVNHFRVALEAVFGLGIRLQAFLQDESENFLVSPISAAIVIGQLILGAEGEFRKQLVELLALPKSHLYENDVIHYYNKKKNVTYFLPYSTLHLQLSNLLKALESGTDENKHFILTEKSALFLDKEITLNDTFRRSLRGLYETRIHQVDFQRDPVGAQHTVNAWVNKSTNGLIHTLFAAPPLPSTSSIFATAIYFKAEWMMPFSDSINRPGLFNVTPNRTVPVTYMINQFDQILYSEAPDFRIVALPYTNEELGMYIILPRSENPLKFDMKAFIQKLTFREVLETVENGKRRNVVVKLPKMNLSNTFSILDQLRKYRLFKEAHIKVNSTNPVDKLEARVDAFVNFTTNLDEDIYLTTAALDRRLRVGEIIQQVVININEKGTEAAAVSASTIDYIGGAKNFLVERPFVFFIRHEATSASLFWGTVSNPTA